MKYRRAAGVLITRPHNYDQILLVTSPYKDHWDLPGGIVEDGELPSEAAHREVKEELGIVLPDPLPLLVSHTVMSAGRTSCLTAYIFDGGNGLSNIPAVDGTEVTAWSWCGMEMRGEVLKTAPLLYARIITAMANRRARKTTYLEHRA